MITAIRSFIPFIDDNPYSNVRTHVKRKLDKKQGLTSGVTAQELTASLPYQINTVTARLKELRDRGEVYIYEKRECSEKNHSRNVNAYKVRFGVLP